MAANLRRTAALVLGLTLTVNVLNYLRDAVLVARSGASPASDAILPACSCHPPSAADAGGRHPAPAVVPIYLEMAGHSPSQARRLTWQVLLSVAVGLIPLAVLAVFLTPGAGQSALSRFRRRDPGADGAGAAPLLAWRGLPDPGRPDGQPAQRADHFVLPADAWPGQRLLALIVLWLWPAVSENWRWRWPWGWRCSCCCICPACGRRAAIPMPCPHPLTG